MLSRTSLILLISSPIVALVTPIFGLPGWMAPVLFAAGVLHEIWAFRRAKRRSTTEKKGEGREASPLSQN